MLHRRPLPFLVTLSLLVSILTTCASTNQPLPIPTLTLALPSSQPQPSQPSQPSVPPAEQPSESPAEAPTEQLSELQPSEQPTLVVPVTNEEEPTPQTTYLPILRSGYPYNSSFGVVIEPLSNAAGMNQIAAANGRWSRLEMEWRKIQPYRGGAYDWSQVANLEAEILEAGKLDMQVVLIVGWTPGWALKPGSCGAIATANFDAYANLMKEMVQRYSREPYNVKYWELYNEPDAQILGCWGDPSDTSYYGGGHYGEMLKKVYPVMKAANLDVQVMVGGLLLDCDPVNPPDMSGQPGKKKDCTSARFLEGILEAGAGNSFDGVSFHAYDYGDSTGYGNTNWHSRYDTTGPVTLAKASYLRSVLAKYNVPDKFLINTELALLCSFANLALADCTGPAYLEQEAYYLVQVFAASKADNYRLALWYSATGIRGNALFDPNTLEPLPAYHAFRIVNNEIGGVAFKGKLDLGAGIIGYEYQQQADHKWVVWAKDSAVHQITLPKMPKAVYRIGADGVAISMAPATTIPVGRGPVFIEF